MVRRTRFFIITAALAVVALSASGCSKRWWGEKAPARPSAQAGASTSSSCADASRILKGSDPESQETFECWAKQLNGLWDDVRGKQKNSLTDQEIITLIQRGVVNVGANPGKTIQSLLASKKLLGFGPELTREKMDFWMSWIRKNRPEIRRLYQHFNAAEAYLSYEDLRSAGRIASSLLNEVNWSRDSRELGTLLIDALQIERPEIRGSIIPAAQVTINWLDALCPNLNDRELWDTREISACITQAATHFSPGAAYLEFVMNPITDLNKEQVEVIRHSLNTLSMQMDSWLRNPKLGKLLPARWVELAQRLGANPPADFIDSLKVIRRFSERSTENEIFPEDLLHVFDMLKTYHLELLDGLPLYFEAIRQHQCEDANAKTWKECVLLDSGARDKSAIIDLAYRVKSPHHGQLAAPMNGEEFARITLFHAIAAKIIQAFDEDQPGKPKDGLISTDLTGSTTDELVQVIDTGMQTYLSVRSYFDRISNKINGFQVQTPEEGDPAIKKKWNSAWDHRGFAHLITMTSDLLVQHTPQERNALLKFLDNILNTAPSSRTLVLDQTSITAIITTLDMLGRYREAYLKHLPDSAVTYVTESDALISREAFNRNLPTLLRINFPRTYESCMAFGFERSCGIAFDSILSDSTPGSGMIADGDLDVVTLIAAGMEGVFDSCDANGDVRLAWKILDGSDELDCGFAKLKDLVKRLMDSNIIVMTASDKGKIKTLLNVVNSTFLTRPAGKTAMVRGTKSWLVLNPVLFWAFGESATIGSTYGLLADILASDRVDEANRTHTATDGAKKTGGTTPTPGPSPSPGSSWDDLPGWNR